jgi:hypothetical protein
VPPSDPPPAPTIVEPQLASSAPTQSVPPTPASTIDRRGYLSLAFVAGYGFASDYNTGLNYLGGMLGGRASYTFAAPVGFVFGVEGMAHLGSSASTSNQGSPYVTDRVASAAYGGGLLGFDAAAGPVVIRPHLLAGALIVSRECQTCVLGGTCAPCRGEDASTTSGVVGVALSLNFMTRYVFFGTDFRYLYVVGRGSSGTVGGALGVRFR